MLAGRVRPTPNHRLYPRVGAVTAVACATAAPTPPAGQQDRYAIRMNEKRR